MVVLQVPSDYNKSMRDYRKLRAFELADELAILVYSATRSLPKEELFGLTSQLRRAAVSIVSNIVEGSGRDSEADYLRFLSMAYSSASEVCYQLSLAFRLGYLKEIQFKQLDQKSNETAKVLNGLISSLQKQSNNKFQTSSLKSQASGLLILWTKDFLLCSNSIVS